MDDESGESIEREVRVAGRGEEYKVADDDDGNRPEQVRAIIPRRRIVLAPDSNVLVEVMRSEDGRVTCQVVKVVHDDSHEQVQHLRPSIQTQSTRFICIHLDRPFCEVRANLCFCTDRNIQFSEGDLTRTRTSQSVPKSSSIFYSLITTKKFIGVIH